MDKLQETNKRLAYILTQELSYVDFTQVPHRRLEMFIQHVAYLVLKDNHNSYIVFPEVLPHHGSFDIELVTTRPIASGSGYQCAAQKLTITRR